MKYVISKILLAGRRPDVDYVSSAISWPGSRGGRDLDFLAALSAAANVTWDASGVLGAKASLPFLSGRQGVANGVARHDQIRDPLDFLDIGLGRGHDGLGLGCSLGLDHEIRLSGVSTTTNMLSGVSDDVLYPCYGPSTYAGVASQLHEQTSRLQWWVDDEVLEFLGILDRDVFLGQQPRPFAPPFLLWTDSQQQQQRATEVYVT